MRWARRVWHYLHTACSCAVRLQTGSGAKWRDVLKVANAIDDGRTVWVRAVVWETVEALGVISTGKLHEAA